MQASILGKPNSEKTCYIFALNIEIISPFSKTQDLKKGRRKLVLILFQLLQWGRRKDQQKKRKKRHDIKHFSGREVKKWQIAAMLAYQEYQILFIETFR